MGENVQIIKDITRYQENVEKYLKKGNHDKVLHYISRLNKLPIKVAHLEATGVGKTINGLRKYKSSVGDAAKKLVSKWKKMVVSEERESEKDDSNDTRPESENGEHLGSDQSASHENSNTYREHNQTNDERCGPGYSSNDEVKLENQSDEKRYSDSDNEMEICTQEQIEQSSDEEVEKYSPKNERHEKSSKHTQSKSDNRGEKKSNRDGRDVEKHTKSKKPSREKELSSVEDDDESEAERIEYKKKTTETEHRSSKSKSSRKDREDGSSTGTSTSNSKHDHNKENNKKKEKHKDKKVSSHKRHRSPSSDSEPVVEKKKSRNSSHASESSHKSDHPKPDHSKRESSPEIEAKSKREHKSKHQSSSRDKSSSSHRSEKSSNEHKKADKKSHSGKRSDKDDSKSKSKSKEEKSSKVSDKKDKKRRSDAGSSSSQKTAFENALEMCEPVLHAKSHKKKTQPSQDLPAPGCSKSYDEDDSSGDVPALLKEKPRTSEPLIDVNLSTLLPAITPNYRPIGTVTMDDFCQKKLLSEEENLSRIISTKNQRTKVYSGNKTAWGVVPSLFELCTRILQDNIDALEYTGGVPYLILKPILEKATPSQLFQMEHYNPYLILETDELWKLHIMREFKTGRREELETWREMYMRCMDEREAKLRALTANIKQAQDKSLPVRTTKLAYVDDYVKPPRNIARKQAKNGTTFDKKPIVTPSSRLSNVSSGASSSAGDSSSSSARAALSNPVHRAAERSHTSLKIKPKKAPLMAKTLSFLKNRYNRR